ncbi:MAG: hypothetical protein ACPL3E_00685 [Minisyncoccia bacterium]
MNKKYLSIILFGVIFLSSFLKVFAENNNQNQTLSCFFDDKVKELQAVLENKDLDYLSQYNQELKLRKEILLNILDCLILEAQNYKNTVLGINISKTAVGDFRKKLINELDKEIDYLNFRKSQIQNLSLEGLKYTAKSLKEDRQSRFLPLNQVINNFILWNKNEELFNLAENRIDEISKIIKIFKPDENEEIKSLFEDFSSKFKLAVNKHNEAWNAIDAFDNEKSSLLIQDSLNNLLEVYKLIYDFSKKTSVLMSIPK